MTKNEILSWLKQHDDNYSKNEYIINDDMSVDVKGTVNISHNKLTKLPFKFNKIDGGFFCDYNNLTSLENCPKIVNGDFYCCNNQLKSLEHCPTSINSGFHCYNNRLTSLKGIVYVKGYLWCDDHLKESKEYQCYLMMKQLEK